MKKLFLLLIGCLMFGSVFAAGKFDYDATYVDRSYDGGDDSYFEDIKRCGSSYNSDRETKSESGIPRTQEQANMVCNNISTNNLAWKQYYIYSSNRDEIHNYVDKFVKKYKGKKDIPDSAVVDVINFGLSKFQYGCNFVSYAFGFGKDLINTYNADKFGMYYNFQCGESFLCDSPDYPIINDLAKISWYFQMLCPQPNSTNYILEDAPELTTKIGGVNPSVCILGESTIGGVTSNNVNCGNQSSINEAKSGFLDRGYIPFEQRYLTHPIGNNTNITNNNAIPQISYNNPQLQQAVTWMNGSGLTKFDNPTDFMANQSLRRDEASKFFVQYAIQVQKLVPDETKTECNKFSDLNKGRPDLKETIKNACKLGLFQGYNGEFMPTSSLTNEQAITVLIRLIDGKKDESGTHFGQKYFEKAQQLGIMSGLSLGSSNNFDKLSSRGEIGMLLYSTNINPYTKSRINTGSVISINKEVNKGGTLTIGNGCKYIGEITNNQPNGEGTVTCADGSKYVGEWKNGKYDGQGTFTFSDGTTYIGGWKNGKYDGQGIDTFSNGTVYDGEFKDGKRNGQGTMTYDGNKYIGEWENGKRSGQGTETFTSGLKYIGQFLNDTFNGQGTSILPKTGTYIGEFKDGKMTGKGELISLNGDKYVGGFIDGKFNGQGTFMSSNGNGFSCVFYNNSCTSNYKSIITSANPVVTTCSSNQHLEGSFCISNTKSCTKTNGIGQQTWNGSSRGSCTVISCNNGYQASNNSCVVTEQTTSLSSCHSERITLDYVIPERLYTRDYVLGNGNSLFKTDWSMCSDNCVYVYRNSSMEGVALANDILNINDIVDATKFTYKTDYQAPNKGQIIIYKNMNNFYMAIKIIDIQNNSNDKNNIKGTVVFDYVIQTDGTSSFANCTSL